MRGYPPLLCAILLCAQNARAGIAVDAAEAGCPGRAQVVTALEARIPGITGAGPGPRLELAPSTPGVTLRLREASGALALERELTLDQRAASAGSRAEGCEALAEAAALVVARYLREIGHRAPAAAVEGVAEPPAGGERDAGRAAGPAAGAVAVAGPAASASTGTGAAAGPGARAGRGAGVGAGPGRGAVASGGPGAGQPPAAPAVSVAAGRAVAGAGALSPSLAGALSPSLAGALSPSLAGALSPSLAGALSPSLALLGVSGAGRVGGAARGEVLVGFGLHAWRLALDLAGGASSSTAIAVPGSAGQLSLRAYPLRVAVGVPLRVPGGALVPSLGLGLDLLSFAATGLADARSGLRLDPAAELGAAYLVVGPRLYVALRVGAGLALAPRDFDAGGPAPVFRTPGATFRAQVEVGVVLWKNRSRAAL